MHTYNEITTRLELRLNAQTQHANDFETHLFKIKQLNNPDNKELIRVLTGRLKRLRQNAHLTKNELDAVNQLSKKHDRGTPEPQR